MWCHKLDDPKLAAVIESLESNAYILPSQEHPVWTFNTLKEDAPIPAIRQ